MSGNFLLKDYGSAINLVTTGAAPGNASLANAAYALSGVLDNTSGGASGVNSEFADIVLVTASMTPLAPNYAVLYRIPASDGSNYGDGDTTNGPAPGTPQFIAGATLAASVVHRIIWQTVPLLPGLQKFLLLNQLGATIPSSWSLTAYPSNIRYT